MRASWMRASCRPPTPHQLRHCTLEFILPRSNLEVPQGARETHSRLGQEYHVVRELLEIAHDVRRHDHCAPRSAVREDLVLERRARDWVEARRRLVENEQVWREREREGRIDLLERSAG